MIFLLLIPIIGACVGRLIYDRRLADRQYAIVGIIGAGLISFIGMAAGSMTAGTAFVLAAVLTGLGALLPRIAVGVWTGANQGAHDLFCRLVHSRRFWIVVGIVVVVLVLVKHQEFVPTILTLGVLYLLARWAWGKLRRL